MRRRYNSRRRGGSSGNLWLSFSDLMSSLLLIIILILFYVMYQYFEMYEVNMAEIARQQSELETQQEALDDAKAAFETQQQTLDTTQSALDTARSTLTQREQELLTAQTELAARETELADRETELSDAQTQLETAQSDLETAQAALETQQSQLETAQSDLETAQAQLETQQSQLETAQSDLETAQAALLQQQTTLEEQQTQLENQQSQLENLIGIRPKIIQSLSAALKQANIAATVDPTTGAITLEADVLFDSGEYTLKDAGKQTIDSFLPVYLDVLFSEEYEPYLSQIIIEGHTDTRGDYMTNLRLSQERAGSVAEYVLSDSYTVITAAQREKLRKYTTANGRSFSDPVYAADGSVDLDKSRRVVFKFQLIDEQMVAQLQQILDEETGTESRVVTDGGGHEE